MRTFKLSDFDPCHVEVSEETMAKYRHVLADGDRVRVIESGHVGVLQGVNHGGGHTVKLDSGHTIVCREHELEPETFPHHVEPAPAKASLTPAQFAGLQRALALGQLDELDSYLVRKAFRFGAMAGMAAFDVPETSEERDLRLICAKLHLGASASTGSDDGSSFAKAAGAGRPTFQVGDRILDDWGNLGKIKAISQGRAEITYDNGIEGSVLMGRFKAA